MPLRVPGLWGKQGKEVSMKTENKALPAGPWQFERRHDGDPYTWLCRDTEHGKEYLLKISNLPAAAASPQPCEIIGDTQLDMLVVKYLGGGKGNITTEEIEILLFALYIESKARGGLALRGSAAMDRRLSLQGTVATVPPQAETDSEVR